MWSHPSSGHTLMLDNGLIELGEPDPTSLIYVCEQVRPTNAICPDKMFDSQQTVDWFREFGPDLSPLCSEVMVVPQGKQLLEWMECVRELSSLSAELHVNITFAVTKLLNETEIDGQVAPKQPREYALIWLEDFMRQHQFFHRVHLLGIHSNLIHAAATCQHARSIVRGIDSTFPFAAACSGELVGWTTNKHHMVEPDWHIEPTNRQLALASMNIAVTRRILSTPL